MSVYHQMGHDSINIVNHPLLSQYSGVILSPVNYNEEKIISQVSDLRGRDNFEVIFDPQLYYPQSERGKLREWSYFPSDVDTALITSEAWWQNVAQNVIDTCTKINCHSACSPVFAPRSYTNDYYAYIVRLGNYFTRKINDNGINSIQSILVNLADLENSTRVNHIASIISQAESDRIYLVFVSGIEPRRELNNTEELKNAMRLIRDLEKCGFSVLVGFCSTEFVLWKAAGATSCATGKFFNLRRFTSSRFEEPSSGGGQLPYWFEEGLLAFMRESDLIRLQRNGLISNKTLENPFSIKIIEKMEREPGKPWLSISWRQYMYAFSEIEERLSSGETTTEELLLIAEKNWLKVEDYSLLMEEARNNGSWIRSWRRALAEFNELSINRN